MKVSIRTKFALGMVFIFTIIVIFLGYSAFYLNKLSNKTGTILKENYVSLVYSRNIQEALNILNQEIVIDYLEKQTPSKPFILKEMDTAAKYIQQEKNNITEPGEDKLVATIEENFMQYRDSLLKLSPSKLTSERALFLQKKWSILDHQLVLLSQMNGKAIEAKTEDAIVSTKKAMAQITILGSTCFLIALSFIYSFAAYFNERFSHLFISIKKTFASINGQSLNFEGADEFNEIYLLFDKIAEKLSGNQIQFDQPNNFKSITVEEENENNVEELKDILIRIRSIEKQAKKVLARMEKQT